MYDIKDETIDAWLKKYEDFNYDLKRYVYTYCKACGIYPHFDDRKLRILYDNWIAILEYWQSSLVPENTDRLSHLKVFSVLLTQLGKLEWVKDFEPFDIASEELKYNFSGSVEQFREIRGDIVNGRGAFLGLEFVLNIINAFEKERLDRIEPFCFRLTDDLRHDILIYLRSDNVDAMGVYLIIKALYARDPS